MQAVIHSQSSNIKSSRGAAYHLTEAAIRRMIVHV